MLIMTPTITQRKLKNTHVIEQKTLAYMRGRIKIRDPHDPYKELTNPLYDTTGPSNI